ncbi:hypothetical protein Ddc_08775 [Ditylenchus destructor]|nr:hypothetical protein Ddc_08775 [Ditylenchus destructor]
MEKKNKVPIDQVDDKIDAWTFIRTVKKESIERNDHLTPESPEHITDNGTIHESRATKSAGSPSTPPRKCSEDSSLSSTLASKLKLKPSLRMKAFVNRRQDTFHSLEMCVDHSEEVPGPSHDSDSPASLAGDFLKMPSIESMHIAPAIQNRIHKKNHSDPTIMASGLKSKNPSPETVCGQTATKNGDQAQQSKTKRVLHTFPHPDGSGCVIGYCTDEPVTENQRNSSR